MSDAAIAPAPARPVYSEAYKHAVLALLVVV